MWSEKYYTFKEKTKCRTVPLMRMAISQNAVFLRSSQIQVIVYPDGF